MIAQPYMNERFVGGLGIASVEHPYGTDPRA